MTDGSTILLHTKSHSPAAEKKESDDEIIFPSACSNLQLDTGSVHLQDTTHNDIGRMSHDEILKRLKAAGHPGSYAKMEAAARKTHETLYLPLTAALDSWTDTAMEQMPLAQGRSYRINQRLLYKAAYEVHYLGGTQINPLQEEADLGDTTLLNFALTHDLVPGARKIVPKNWGGGQNE